MHIGLNLAYLVPGETGGMETYARELIPALIEARPDVALTAFLSREAAASTTAPWCELVDSVTLPVNARQRWQWVRGDQELVPRLARRAGVDVVHSLASTGPAWGSFRRVVTIHDVIYRIYPEAHAGIRARAMGILVPLAARRSHRVIAPSKATARDLERLLHVPGEKIDVVPNGVDAPGEHTPLDGAEVRRRFDLGGRQFVLSASAKRRHKNLARLLEALSLIPAERRPMLVLPGYATAYEGELRDIARQRGVAADTRFLSWVSEEELDGLFANAACFVFPSLYEGFGLPVLEAMARGVPVACSASGSLGEVAGSAALVFDPESPRAIAEAVQHIIGNADVAERLRRVGRENASRFTWKATAEATLRTYERTLAGSK